MNQYVKYQSTVNDVCFSVPADDDNNIKFLNDPSVQPFISKENKIRATSKIEGLDIVEDSEENTEETEVKASKRGRKPKTDVEIEIES